MPALSAEAEKTLLDYEATATRASLDTQFEFALVLLSHKSSTLHHEKGLKLIRRLSDAAFAPAQYKLACILAQPSSPLHKQNLPESHALLVDASKRGQHADASFLAAHNHLAGQGCSQDPGKAVQFLKRAAIGQHIGAMTMLGLACVKQEHGLKHQEKEGVKWLKRAAEGATSHFNDAPYQLGILHETGFLDLLLRDHTFALQCYVQAADLGHLQAAFRLAECYEFGLLGCPIDPGLSIHYYTMAACPEFLDHHGAVIVKDGLPPAYLALCAWLLVGYPPLLDKNEQEAFLWALKASQAGSGTGHYCVGVCYQKGIGVKRSLDKAMTYYLLAKQAGDERAIKRLSMLPARQSSPLKDAFATRRGSSDHDSEGEHKEKPKEDCLMM
ncbi:hypothetical protein BCR37DRAFT_65359 [Protomyces lactucae-debilis]|uniref:HCP-like protein n=1 Tax=Protomyces lactucae-debilis TaxID=2754530 RepID=A0A1Y2F8X2_PROLT|nr:uncharacterized protein BCR37DRAFT_65359 [Protomyces lactucae-debilis]ORY80351.1 hypothetical protein BCR37DRAFT_65359 [Protomyces lactucae-debilis]